MKTSKKLLSLLLVFVMAFSLTNGFIAKAEAGTVTVTLRVEQDEATLITPVSITLTEADKKDYGIGLSTTMLTPLHALAKYLSENKGATDETMANYIHVSESEYGLFLTGISMDGTSAGSPAAGNQDGVSWMYNVDNTATTVGMSAFELKDNASVVIYGVWGGGTWPDSVETYYSYLDKTNYETTANSTLSVSLTGIGWSDAAPLKGASVIASEYKGTASTATEQNAILTAKTDAKGMASLTFTKAGSYVLSAYRKASDGTHYDISRPYAIVKVKNVMAPTSKPTQTSKPTKKPNVLRPTPTPSPTGKVKKPAKPKRLKATVKKSSKKKKTIKLIWRVPKCNKADGYRVYLSKKKKKGYKKLADTKKAKLTFKRKKGTYYVKVRAYKNTEEFSYQTGKKRLYSSYSKALKIKVR